MLKIIFKPLWEIIIVYAIGGLAIASDIAQLTNFNIVDFIKGNSPYSYYGILVSTIILYFVLLLISYFKATKNHMVRKDSTDQPEEFYEFIVLLSMQCSETERISTERLIEISRKLLRIMKFDLDIDYHSVLNRLDIKQYIDGYQENFFMLKKAGKEVLYSYMETHWSILSDVLQENYNPNDSVQDLLCKYIVENMPYEERIRRLDKIISFLTKYYANICAKYDVNGILVNIPFQLLNRSRIETVKSVIDMNVQAKKILYDLKYYNYYLSRQVESSRADKVEKQVFNGSVYRLLDWDESREREFTLYVGIDRGYIDFQSTCGKIRNEIDHNIIKYNGDVEETADLLKYRQLTMHCDNEHQHIAEQMKTRIVKIGIETTVILVDTNEEGYRINPRVPVVFRGRSVAEYPEFSMVVPSGAYQASLLMDNANEDYFHKQILDRVSWEVSVIRELGEELFDIHSLEEYDIENLTNTQQYNMCKAIIKDAILFKPTGFGIDLYLGSGCLLVTLILDYQKVLEIMERYAQKCEDDVLRKAYNKFIDTCEKRATTRTEGLIYLFNLDKDFLNSIVSYYSGGTQMKITPKNAADSVDFKPMIPSGVLSILNAKIELDLLGNCSGDTGEVKHVDRKRV